MMTRAESPMAAQAPPGSADRILHARRPSRRPAPRSNEPDSGGSQQKCAGTFAWQCGRLKLPGPTFRYVPDLRQCPRFAPSSSMFERGRKFEPCPRTSGSGLGEPCWRCNTASTFACRSRARWPLSRLAWRNSGCGTRTGTIVSSTTERQGKEFLCHGRSIRSQVQRLDPRLRSLGGA